MQAWLAVRVSGDAPARAVSRSQRYGDPVARATWALENCPLRVLVIAANERELVARQRLRQITVASIKRRAVNLRGPRNNATPKVREATVHPWRPVMPSGGVVSPSANFEGSWQ